MLLYYVSVSDNLQKIAEKFHTSADAIYRANIICNPNILFPDQPLLIPQKGSFGTELPMSGGLPYYIMQPGDSLYYLAARFGTSVDTIVKNNQVPNPNLVFPGTELLLLPAVPNAEKLKDSWEKTAKRHSGQISDIMEYGVYFTGTYEWQAIGSKAVPYLLELLNSRYQTVRYYAAMSLGRLSLNGKVQKALEPLLEGETRIADMARLALEKIKLAGQGARRVHLITADTKFVKQPNKTSEAAALQLGTEVIVLRWHIPSPKGEETLHGDNQIYDYIQVVKTGQMGYIPRAGYNEALLL